ncbi:MAG: hypothetical protein QOE46_1138 [Acidobacteriota bacterium]|jgi:uncharacterized membrane protein|nr:hypothetical protein [Acidobacteriota bacterium]
MPKAISEYMPQLVHDEESARRAGAAWAAWGVALCGAAALVGMIVAAPVLRASGAVGVAGAIYKGFGLVCHQMNARSFHVEGFQLAVCARCFGLYVGALAGVAAYPLARRVGRRDLPARAWLIAAAVPTTVDFALGFFGVWENTHLSRFLTASLLGVVSAFYIVPGLVDLSLSPLREFFRPGLAREG